MEKIIEFETKFKDLTDRLIERDNVLDRFEASPSVYAIVKSFFPSFPIDIQRHWFTMQATVQFHQIGSIAPQFRRVSV